MQLRNTTRQAYVRVHVHTTASLLRVSLCSTGSKFDLLSEVIFKDLAVPAVTVKLTLGRWFVLDKPTSSCGHVLLIATGIRRQVM